MYSEVELCDKIRTSILSLCGTLDDGYSYVQLDTVSLLSWLANQFKREREDIDWLYDGSNETREERGDEPMEVD